MKQQPPKPAPKGLNKTIPNANPKTQLNSLAGQIQGLATRLEALRAEGMGDSAEFKQIEQLLTSVQDKVLLAQAKISP
jgi:hypothetical protein